MNEFYEEPEYSESLEECDSWSDDEQRPEDQFEEYEDYERERLKSNTFHKDELDYMTHNERQRARQRLEWTKCLSEDGKFDKMWMYEPYKQDDGFWAKAREIDQRKKENKK